MGKTKIKELDSLSEDGKKVFDVLNDEPDPICALVGASYIDACLASMLQKHLKKSSVTERLLNPNTGILGALSNRADMAYCLELIDKMMYQDIIQIAKIRNLFAHNHETLSFSSGEIVSLCNDLQYLRKMFGQVQGIIDAISSDANKYKITVAIISQKLVLKGLGISSQTDVT